MSLVYASSIPVIYQVFVIHPPFPGKQLAYSSHSRLQITQYFPSNLGLLGNFDFFRKEGGSCHRKITV